MKTIQTDIDRFIFRTGGDPWISVKRRYLPPSEGGMGAVNIETYANSLRCSWYKRIKSGLWSNILLVKVDDARNCCYIQKKDIHKMHISILPIVKAFETLQANFTVLKGDSARMNTPLDQLALIKHNNARRRNMEGSKPTKTTHSNLFKNGKICEITGSDLATPDTVYSDSPKLKPDEELWAMLNINHLHFLRRAEILRDIKKLFKVLVEDFTEKEEIPSLPEMFAKVKKAARPIRRFYCTIQI